MLDHELDRENVVAAAAADAGDDADLIPDKHDCVRANPPHLFLHLFPASPAPSCPVQCCQIVGVKVRDAIRYVAARIANEHQTPVFRLC